MKSKIRNSVKRMEFSKRITVLSWAVALILTLLAIVLPIEGYSPEGVSLALPYAWGEVAAVNALYLWKAKNENRHKYAQLYVDKIAETHGIETAIRIAEVVLTD